MISTNDRLIELLDYVEEMARMTERAVFSVQSYRALTFLEHQLRSRFGIQHDTTDDDGPVWLRIERLQRSDPPVPDAAINDWLVISRDPTNPPQVLETRLAQMPLADAAKLVAEGRIDAADVMEPPGGRGEDAVDVRLRLDRWPELEEVVRAYVIGPWRRWADEERPRRETIAIYDKFFSALQTIETTGAENPAEVVLGVGMALWRTAGRTIEHPLIESLVELDIAPDSHAIRVRPRETDPEIHLKPFEEIDNPGTLPLRGAAAERLAALAAGRADQDTEVEARDFSPFERRAFEPILRLAVTLLSSSGVYHPDVALSPSDRTTPQPDETLTVTDTWAIYVRPRSGNLYVQDVQRLKAQIECTDEAALPPSAQRFVSPPPDEQVYVPAIDLSAGIGGAAASADGRGSASTGSPAPPRQEVLFPKPYNDAQVEIVHRLDRADGVVVQGPPGTGKTHTIANIICHYLATGRSVLVTSKGEPALEVLREQIPEEVRDLAISLLTSEREGLKQLERTVTLLASDVTRQDPGSIEAARAEREAEIVSLRRELERLDAEIRAFAERQLAPVAEELAGGSGLRPAELACTVVENRESYRWLPDRLGPEPLYEPRFVDQDLAAVRTARRRLAVDLAYLGCNLPALNDLPDAAMVCAVHDDLTRAAALGRAAKADDLPPMSTRADDALARAEELLIELRRLHQVLRDLAECGWLARQYAAWLLEDQASTGAALPDRLLDEMGALVERRQTFLGRPVVLPQLDADRHHVSEAVRRAARGVRPFAPLALGRGRAKQMFHKIRVGGRPPTDASEWAHVEVYITYEDGLGAFASRWNALADQLDLPELDADPITAGRRLAEMHARIERARQAASSHRGRTRDELRQLFPYGIDANAVAWDARALDRAIRALETNLAAHRLSAARSGLDAALARLTEVVRLRTKQARYIQNLLIERIGEDPFLRHHIACGDSAAFQGKERDVMFLSMVASPGRAQAQTALLYQQRFNVALSRARDRMYLFRSVEPEHLANPRDLKFRVIQHFRHPMPAPSKKTEALIDLCESDFEREVFRRLTALGYRVTPQVAVGAFRIDLVVEGAEDRRLAVELDGDRYHGPERWFEDWSRQEVLERVGWRFWRCWASSFALDPDACMSDLTDTLEAIGIHPVGAAEFRHIYTEHRALAGPEVATAPATADVDDEEPEAVVEPGDKVAWCSCTTRGGTMR